MTRLNPTTTPRQQLRAAKGQRNREAALSAFRGKKVKIDEILTRLASLSANHFSSRPDGSNWADVGTLDHYASLLKRIANSAFCEGEHAE